MFGLVAVSHFQHFTTTNHQHLVSASPFYPSYYSALSLSYPLTYFLSPLLYRWLLRINSSLALLTVITCPKPGYVSHFIDHPQVRTRNTSTQQSISSECWTLGRVCVIAKKKNLERPLRPVYLLLLRLACRLAGTLQNRLEELRLLASWITKVTRLGCQR